MDHDMKNKTTSSSRRVPVLGALACALTLAALPTARADAPTDGALAADHAGYRAQQAAIQRLNDTGAHPLRSFSLAKAQCWLDVSFHEYTRNDRSRFPQEALDQSRLITDFLTRGGAVGAADNPAQQTPLVNGAAKLRDDLWAQAAALKGHAGWRCAERLVACGEVELVHAGNEHHQQGWRHAKPYIQIAEDLIGDAKAAADACPPVPKHQVDLPPVEPPPVVINKITEKIVLNASVLFGFDRRRMDDLLPGGRAQLDQVVAKLDRVYASVERLTLVGHTDRLGRPDYNERLSADRAAAIRDYLQQQGVKVPIETIGRGSAEPVPGVTCTQRNLAQLRACLQPNRRVEILITGVPR